MKTIFIIRQSFFGLLSWDPEFFCCPWATCAKSWRWTAQFNNNPPPAPVPILCPRRSLSKKASPEHRHYYYCFAVLTVAAEPYAMSFHSLYAPCALIAVIREFSSAIFFFSLRTQNLPYNGQLSKNGGG